MKQAWIKSPLFDSIFFLGPLVLPVLFILMFPATFQNQSYEISTAAWVGLVLLVDVTHVYSTIYRTYFNKLAWLRYSVPFKLVPLICLISGILLYSISSLLFWRCLAYLAVFHFIRQQYGFMRLYSLKENQQSWMNLADKFIIYGVTLLPVLIWHAQGPKQFNWFTEGDFIYFKSGLLVHLLQIVYGLLLLFYLLLLLYQIFIYRYFNLPKTILISGTAISWYLGIVYYNGDLSFTMLNVLAHGIPYMALIWVSEKKNLAHLKPSFLKHFFKTYGILLFLGFLMLLAYVEEGLWDAVIWREHESVFKPFYAMHQLQTEKALVFLVPLLSLPQAVHYILDGFIWKRDKTGNS